MILKWPLAQVKCGIRGCGRRDCGSRGRMQLQMPISARDIDNSGTDSIPLMSFANLQRAAAVEPLGKQVGKNLRHMLDD